MIYDVTVRERYVLTYEVEADSPEEAQQIFEDGELGSDYKRQTCLECDVIDITLNTEESKG